jgi:hypothetical protein
VQGHVLAPAHGIGRQTFRPERRANNAAGRLPRFAYFPFGGGPRQCIGNPFATMEAILMSAPVLHRSPVMCIAWRGIDCGEAGYERASRHYSMI